VRRVQVAPSRIPPRCVLDQQLPRGKVGRHQLTSLKPF
jgi:hypothetical protein